MFTNVTYNYSRLPPHIIAQILKKLEFNQRLTATRVCKSWYDASFDPIITQSIQIQIRQNFEHLEELRRPFGKLLLSDTNFANFEYIHFFEKFGQYIKMVEFDKCVLSLHQLIECIVLMPGLLSLKIKTENTFKTPFNIVKYDNTELAIILNRLKCFFVKLDFPDSGGLRFLLSLMINLKVLSFGSIMERNTKDISSGYASYMDEIYKTLFDYLNMHADLNLEQLILENTHCLPPHSFRHFIQIRHNLNVYSVVLGQVENFIKFENFCQKLCNVRKLSIQCSSMDECHIIDMCRYMTRLEELILYKMTCFKLQVLSTLQYLKKLTLDYHYSQAELHDKEQNLAQTLLQLHNLTELRITGFVSEYILKSICHNCKQLTTIELFWVEANSFTDIFQYLRQLKRLTLCFDGTIMEKDVDYGITNLQLLEELRISDFAPGMTWDLIKQLPNLKMSSFKIGELMEELVQRS